MLSNKRSRIFVSFLTLLLCLSMLAVGTRAQGPEGDANDAASVSEVTVDEPGPNPDANIEIHKTLLSDTIIQSGDEITYQVNVTNTTATTITGIKFSDKMPNNTRFNYIINDGGRVFTFSQANYAVEQITSAAGITLALHQRPQPYSTTFQVDTNDAACGVPIVNRAEVTHGSKTYFVERSVTPYDQIHRGPYNMEADGGKNVPGVNFFHTVSPDENGDSGWNHGVPLTPTFLGATSGVRVWGTNLTGPYTDTNANYRTQIMTGTLNLATVPRGGSVHFVWQQYIKFLTNFGRARIFIGPRVANNTHIQNTTPVYDSDVQQPSGGLLNTKGWEQKTLEINPAHLINNLQVVFMFTTPGNDVNSGTSADPHWGWYVDDIGITSCNNPGLVMNKVASTIAAGCTVDGNASTISKKLSKRGFAGLHVPPNTEVYYCFAVRNTGNVNLVNHTLYDTLLRDGEIITPGTYNDYLGDPDLQFLSNTGLLPGRITNTFDLLNKRDPLGTRITPTMVITEDTVNTATWRANIADNKYYQVERTSGHSDKNFASIATSGERLELKDDSNLTITLPFNFNLFDEEHAAFTKVVIGNNGGILFANSISNVLPANAPLPLTHTHGVNQSQGQAIFPLWDDWATGNVYSDVRGTAPFREWVLEWRVPQKQASGSGDPDLSTANIAVFQAIMYESLNDIVFTYDDIDVGNTTYNNGRSATVGLSNRISETRQHIVHKASGYLQNGDQIRFRKTIVATDTEAVTIQESDVTLTTTISIDGAACDINNTNNEEIFIGQEVTLCYYITNHGTVTMTHYHLNDTRSGNIAMNAELPVVNGDMKLGLGETMLIHQETFEPDDTTMIDVDSRVFAADKYPFRTSRDVVSPTIYNFSGIRDIGRIGGNGLPNPNIGTPLQMEGGFIDNSEANVKMPFEFLFYREVSDQLRIGNNGGMLFAQTQGDVSPNNTKLPNFEHPFGIFPYWDTFEGEQGRVYTEVIDGPDGREFIVQWDEMQHFDQSTDQGTFQVILYENTNRIKFQYQDLDFGQHAAASNQTEAINNGSSATIGLNHFGHVSRNPYRGDAHEYSFNNMRQSSLLTNTIHRPRAGFAIEWEPISELVSNDLTVTVNFTPSVRLTKTVGTNPAECAEDDDITVIAGDRVYYCYEVENTGNTTLNSHTLVDDKLNNGLAVTLDSFELAPGEITNTVSLGLEFSTVLVTDTMNTATWVGTSTLGRGLTPEAEDTAMVTIEMPPTAVEVGELGVSRSSGLPLGSLVVGMLLLVAGGYVVHRRRMQ